MTADGARVAAEAAARDSYGRLVAYLASRARNIAAAEDALADAFAAALEHWAREGPPANPDAWLLTAARRKLIDAGRRASVRKSSAPDIVRAIEEAADLGAEEPVVDERLNLLLICAHPAIEESVRTPLMLQTVLGLDAARIASAFLVSPATMSQRLVRAKRKIAEARIPFAAPDTDELAPRAEAVLDAIYAAFGAGYDDSAGADGGAELTREAIFLAGLAARLFATNAEAWGLLSLMTFVEARRAARRVEGRFVPLGEQETSRWDLRSIAAAEETLAQAARFKAPGRFQVEAAIQSAHVSARLTGADTRAAVVRLYDRLLAVAPSTGAEIARAAALLKADRAQEALAALDAIGEGSVANHQPYWATRAHSLAACGSADEARMAFDRAIGLSSDPAARAFLTGAKASIPAS
jgi:RNA polymerase sigma-70 factor (ECF subfamily)